MIRSSGDFVVPPTRRRIGDTASMEHARAFYTRGDEADCLVNEPGKIPPPETRSLDDISKLCIKFDHLILGKIVKFLANQVSYFNVKMHQVRFRLRLRPRPRWESLQRSPDPLAGLRGPTSKGREGEGEIGNASPLQGGIKGRGTCCRKS